MAIGPRFVLVLPAVMAAAMSLRAPAAPDDSVLPPFEARESIPWPNTQDDGKPNAVSAVQWSIVDRLDQELAWQAPDLEQAGKDLGGPLDFERAKQSVARKYKVSLAQVEEAVEKWSGAVRKAQAEPSGQAAAEFLQQHFAGAIRLAGDAAVDAMERSQANGAEGAKWRRRAAADLERQGRAFYGLAQWDEAIAAYERGLRFCDATGNRATAARLQLLLGRAQEAAAQSGEPTKARQHGAAAIAAYREARELGDPKAPKHQAIFEINLGGALEEQALRSNGAERASLLVEAVAADRAALTLLGGSPKPAELAAVANELGVTLGQLARGAEEGEKTRYLTEEAAAYEAALTGDTREIEPRYRARIEMNLGVVCRQLADRNDQAAARSRWLDKAVSAYRQALTAMTPEHEARLWAKVQEALGRALAARAAHCDGPDGGTLAREAVAALRAALTVTERESMPDSWAGLQAALANELRELAEKCDRKERVQILREAITAYNAALTVDTREAQPRKWGGAQAMLALAWADLANHSGGAEAERAFEEAVVHFRAATEYFTKESDPGSYAELSGNAERIEAMLKAWRLKEGKQ